MQLPSEGCFQRDRDPSSVSNLDVCVCVCVFCAVQFEGAEKGRMSPTKDGKSRPPQRHSSGCLVNMKMSSVDQCGPLLGERIDPNMPLESQL